MEEKTGTAKEAKTLQPMTKEEREAFSEFLSRESLSDEDWQHVYEVLSGYELYTILDADGRVRPWNGTYFLAATRAPLNRFVAGLARNQGMRIVPTGFEEAAFYSVRSGIPMRIWISKAVESRGLYYQPKEDEMTILDMTDAPIRV